MRCPICSQPIADTEPTVPLPELAGGGNAHVGCWEQVKPWARRLLDEFDLKDYTGLVESDDGEEA